MSEKTENSVSIPVTGEIAFQINTTMQILVIDGKLTVYKTRKEAVDILADALNLPALPGKTPEQKAADKARRAAKKAEKANAAA